MLPSAQTACSRTSSTGDESSSMKMGTAPASMTTCVCSDVPDAMFVSAQAASNCAVRYAIGPRRTWIIECGLRRNSTKRATTPHSMTFSMGGLRSFESSLRNLVVESS